MSDEIYKCPKCGREFDYPERCPDCYPASSFAAPPCSAAAARDVRKGFYGLTCTRCGMLFEDEAEAEDHLNGPMCEPQQPNDKLTDAGTKTL